MYCENKGSTGNRTPANSQSYFSILLVYGLKTDVLVLLVMKGLLKHLLLVWL